MRPIKRLCKARRTSERNFICDKVLQIKRALLLRFLPAFAFIRNGIMDNNEAARRNGETDTAAAVTGAAVGDDGNI